MKLSHTALLPALTLWLSVTSALAGPVAVDLQALERLGPAPAAVDVLMQSNAASNELNAAQQQRCAALLNPASATLNPYQMIPVQCLQELGVLPQAATHRNQHNTTTDASPSWPMMNYYSDSLTAQLGGTRVIDSRSTRARSKANNAPIQLKPPASLRKPLSVAEPTPAVVNKVPAAPVTAVKQATTAAASSPAPTPAPEAVGLTQPRSFVKPPESAATTATPAASTPAAAPAVAPATPMPVVATETTPPQTTDATQTSTLNADEVAQTEPSVPATSAISGLPNLPNFPHGSGVKYVEAGQLTMPPSPDAAAPSHSPATTTNAQPTEATLAPPVVAAASTETQVASVPPATATSPAQLAENMLGQITFSARGSDISAEQMPAIQELAKTLIKEKERRVQLLAYAASDEQNPSISSARRLSLSRALAVRSALLNAGVTSIQVDVRALGTHPEVPTANRVDIVKVR